jgi:hypothetical protein
MFYHDEFDIGRVVPADWKLPGALSPGCDYERQKLSRAQFSNTAAEDG